MKQVGLDVKIESESRWTQALPIVVLNYTPFSLSSKASVQNGATKSKTIQGAEETDTYP